MLANDEHTTSFNCKHVALTISGVLLSLGVLGFIGWLVFCLGSESIEMWKLINQCSDEYAWAAYLLFGSISCIPIMIISTMLLIPSMYCYKELEVPIFCVPAFLIGCVACVPAVVLIISIGYDIIVAIIVAAIADAGNACEEKVVAVSYIILYAYGGVVGLFILGIAGMCVAACMCVGDN